MISLILYLIVGMLCDYEEGLLCENNFGVGGDVKIVVIMGFNFDFMVNFDFS